MNNDILKDKNINTILRSINRLGPITRIELTEITGFSPATISNHVSTLLKTELVLEKSKGNSTGGRKPVYLNINPNKKHIFSIDIGVNKVKIILFNLRLKISVKSELIILKKNNHKKTLKKIFSEIDLICKENNLDFENILGIGIAVPGLIDKDNGILKFAPNLEWEEVKLFDIFNDKYNCSIIIENEATVAAIGEKEFAYPHINNMVYVSINEGVGCGIIINGKLYRGESGNAGEFGHLIVDKDGQKCHCGNRGCWETISSECYILNSYKEVYDRKIINIEEIYKQGKDGDKEVIKIFKKVGKNIGIGLVNIINSLSPKYIIIGGNIINIKDYIYEDIIKILKMNSLKVSVEKVQVKFSKLGNLAPAYGLAYIIYNNLFKYEYFDSDI